MKVSTWILLLIYFASTDSQWLDNEEEPIDPEYTNQLNIGFTSIFFYYIGAWSVTITKNNVQEIKKNYNRTSKGVLANATVIFVPTAPHKILVPSNVNDSFKMYGQIWSPFFEGTLHCSGHRIVTEKIMFDYAIDLTAAYTVNVDYGDFNHDKIKLLPNKHRYRPNEEIKIKKEVVSRIKQRFEELYTNIDFKVFKTAFLLTLQSLHFAFNTREHYYFIEIIPSAFYSLNEVYIYGLWNIKSISINESNLENYAEIEMGAVRGSLEQTLPSSMQELSFMANNFCISMNRKINKVNVKITGYSVLNTQQNTPLTDDQSKRIIEDIESAFAASIQPSLEIFMYLKNN